MQPLRQSGRVHKPTSQIEPFAPETDRPIRLARTGTGSGVHQPRLEIWKNSREQMWRVPGLAGRAWGGGSFFASRFRMGKRMQMMIPAPIPA